MREWTSKRQTDRQTDRQRQTDSKQVRGERERERENICTHLGSGGDSSNKR
jgi:hypothetical protein